MLFQKPLIPYKIRLLFWKFCLIGTFILIFLQLYNIQVSKSASIISQTKKRFYLKPVILRGDIRDRYGNLLGLDIVTYELYNKTKDLTKIDRSKIVKLASLLNITKEELEKRLKQPEFTKITDDVSESTTQKIRKLNADFVYTEAKAKRVYPNEKMASHLIGFVNKDHKGQHGVEYFHENLLTKLTNTNKKPQVFPKGTSIALTIDSALQEFAEEELRKAINKTKAERGAIIVLSPKSGEIYTFAVYPDFNPNFFYKEKAIKNWAITDIYEPGSTFKVITVSSAIENNTINKDAIFYDPGFIKVGKRIIRNHKKNEPRRVNLLELLKHSSNVACAQVGLSMKPEIFYSSIKKFKIGEKTNIDLPGESKGLLIDHKKWRTLDLATTAIGQGSVSVTPLQLACAVASIANGGTWVQPHLLKGIWEPTYELISNSPYQITQEQVVSEETAKYVSDLLKNNVSENVKTMSYIAGDVPGYLVAGKTGTAQKIRPDGKGYLSGHTIASFVGYLPAENPEILILVVVDDPKTEGGWGNTVAGPVFNQVAKMAAKRMLET